MARTQPVQTSFASGELAAQAGSRIDLEPYKHGLSFCENWKVRALGALLLRSGTRHDSSEAATRLFPFHIAGAAEDHVLVLSPNVLRIRSKTGGLITNIATNLVTNGYFDADIDGWTFDANGSQATLDAGAMKIVGPNAPQPHQDVPTVAGHAYTLRVRARASGYGSSLQVQAEGVLLEPDEAPGFLAVSLTPAYQTFTYHFVAADAASTIKFLPSAATPGTWLDDITVLDDAPSGVSNLATPWTAQQLAELHIAPAPAANLVVLLHKNVQPQALRFIAPNVWTLYPAEFKGAPAEWGGTNWPATGEFGFQGRFWLGATPDQPNVVWASRVGSEFDFALGSNAGDPGSWTLSTKGALCWMQGQKVLLAGTEATELSARGSAGIIKPGDIDVSDESAFGSSSVQALHVGNQVLFVTRDRKRLHALGFSQEDGGWVSQALTFLAGHMTEEGIKELHFARAPEPTLLILTQTGKLRAVTYDRAQKVLAWWRIELGVTVRSAAVSDTADGSDLWVALTRGGTDRLERLPMYEDLFLDASVVQTVAAGKLTGLAHLNGLNVRVVANGAHIGDYLVAGGEIALEDLDGVEASVGLAFRAKAKTLPTPESILGKARNARMTALLNDSALPLINGDRDADRTPSTLQGYGEPRQSKKVRTVTLGYDDDGVITIEQELPFRTEVLGLFGSGQASEV